MRKYRKGTMMEKQMMSAKYKTQFWYITLASFLLWLILLYLFNSSVIIARTKETFSRDDNYTASIHMTQSDSVTTDEIPDQVNKTLTVSSDRDKVTKETGDGTEDVKLDRITKGTGDETEDVKAVEDIVEELEKEKGEKDSGFEREQRLETENQILDRDSASNDDRESSKFQTLDGVFVDKDSQEPTNEDSILKKEKTDIRQKSHSVHRDSMRRKKEVKEPVNIQSEPRREELRKNEIAETKTKKERTTTMTESNRRQQPLESVQEPLEKQTENVEKSLQKPVEKRIENEEKNTRQRVEAKPVSNSDPCFGKYVYVHEIPSLFNEELLKHCWTLSRWTDMCQLTSNLGLGPTLPAIERVSGWFSTNQFTLEVIFHSRMKQYKCLTRNSSLASAIFVPYYAGLDVMRYLWGPFPYMRDAAALDLMKWLREKPEWKRMSGRDHFMVAGRTTWDFMRTPENESDWGNRLMILPEPRNMTMLLIESSPWNYHGFAIPYPTYFHPSTDSEVSQWQSRLRRIRRRYLFSFVGAPRPNLGDNIRTDIMNQCKSASRRKCHLLECVSGSNKCYKPEEIMKFFLTSTFCLQPPGDSFTRRSTFDSILAGCIPVFFHPGSAYAQYVWHLPKDHTKYSVFIPAREVKEGRVSIERVLQKVPKAKVVAMREEVIRMIPRVVYADPRGRLERYEDAFDVAVKGVIERVEGMRGKMREGKLEEMLGFLEEFSWKYNLVGNVEKHPWDPYFERP